LRADDLPPGIDEESSARTPQSATLTVAEAGRLIPSGDGTIRRPIRATVRGPEKRPAREGADTDRAGVPPRTARKPGEERLPPPGLRSVVRHANGSVRACAAPVAPGGQKSRNH